MFFRKPNLLSLIQSENYFLFHYLTNFQAIIKNLSIKIFKILGVSKPRKKTCMVSKKKVDLVRKKYDVLLNTGLI